MTDDQQAPTTSDLQRQIETLGNRMDTGFRELKDILRGQDERVRGLENREAACSPMITSRVDAAWREIDTHKTDITNLQKDDDTQDVAIAQLQQQSKLLLWLVGIEGAAVVTWVVSQVLNLIGK